MYTPIKYDWKKDIFDKLSTKRAISHLANDYINFFELAFNHTQIPDKAWFGTEQQGAMSLVVGNIYLAAISYYGDNAGIWIIGESFPESLKGIEGFTCSPIKSTQTKRFNKPLVWIHANSFEAVKHLNTHLDVWLSFKAATAQIIKSSSAAPRDEEHKKKGKIRLIDFFQADFQEMKTMEMLAEYQINFDEQVNQSDPNGRIERIRKKEAYERSQGYTPKKRFIAPRFDYHRDPDIVAERLDLAKGICGKCGSKAPFLKKSNGEPYLEVHHIKPLSQEGRDWLDNTVALCPNCHRFFHYG